MILGCSKNSSVCIFFEFIFLVFFQHLISDVVVSITTVDLPLSAWRIVMSLFFANVIMAFASCLVILLGGGLAVFKIPAISFHSAAFCL